MKEDWFDVDYIPPQKVNLYRDIIEKEWWGMPEFNQEKKEPYKKLIIRFEKEEDYNKFAEIINQKLTKKTKSIWFPYKSHYKEIHKEWRDES